MSKTVKELIEELQQFPEDTIVVMSQDGEGNRFSPYADSGVSLYFANNTWSGEVLNLDEDKDEWPTDEPVWAVVLWPTN